VTPAPAPWLVRKQFPLLATVALVAFALLSTMWWGPHLVGQHEWQLPHDLWGTLLASRRLLHLDLGSLYTEPTGLVSFPGTAFILVPVVALIDATGVGLAVPSPQNPHPGAWLLAGPYEVAISAVALFAADSLAERLGVPGSKRLVLAGASVIALWNVSVRWGHPEDAVAVGLFLFAILALADSRVGQGAWLVGAAVAVQPLVLLALPVLLVVIEPRRVPGFLTRAAVPSAVLLGAAAWANWSATVRAVTHQPNWPTANHLTPWTSFAPHLSGGAVAAGPARALVVLLACGCALAVRHRWRARQLTVAWSAEALEELLWWVAVALALRCVFEPVMTAFYLWPPLAAALVAASRQWSRLVAASICATAVTLLSQALWSGPWIWWVCVTVGLVLTLVFARPRLRDGGSGKPGHVALQQHVTDEGAGVDEAVGQHQPHQTTLALEEAPEQKSHGGIAKKPAKTLIQVIRPA